MIDAPCTRQGEARSGLPGVAGGGALWGIGDTRDEFSAAIVPCSDTMSCTYSSTMEMWLLIQFLAGTFSVHPEACAVAAFRGILSIQMGGA